MAATSLETVVWKLDIYIYIRSKINATLLAVGCDSHLINKKEKEFLVSVTHRIPIIYYLQKVHKSLNNPPGRPIVSGINCHLADW